MSITRAAAESTFKYDVKIVLSSWHISPESKVKNKEPAKTGNLTVTNSY
jgi:hypothetical protein